MTQKKFKLFLITKLPIAYLAGIKLTSYSPEMVSTKVKLGFLNQNPFNSMFWAVQGMAAELSTGVLCLNKIQDSQKKISMLVVEQQAIFTKKAVGTITFSCTQGIELQKVIEEAVRTQDAQSLYLHSEGIDEQGDRVAKFKFLWSFKCK